MGRATSVNEFKISLTPPFDIFGAAEKLDEFKA
jgi:hypothetical protein